MIKIVSNIKKRLAVFLLSALLIGQGSGYLAQKLMVENNIRERIKDALSKIIDSNKYLRSNFSISRKNPKFQNFPKW